MPATRNIHTVRFILAMTAVVLVSQLTLAATPQAFTPLPTPYTPDFSGKGNVHCYCILGVSGCSSDLLWHAQGAPTHDWHQDNFFQEGKAVDLSDACYRKRDSDGQGNGLCCGVDVKDGKPDDKMVHSFFGASEVTH